MSSIKCTLTFREWFAKSCLNSLSDFSGEDHISLDAKGTPILSAGGETSIPNLFVAGELSVPPGKGSIITSFNSGKKVVESLCQKLALPRKPEMVSL